MESLFTPTARKNCKNVYQVDYTTSDFYKFYRQEYAYKKFTTKFDTNQGLLVNRDLYGKVIHDMFKMIAKKIKAGDQFDLPLNIGYIGVKKKKMNFSTLLERKMLKIDYHESKKIQQVVYFTNEHTDGYRYRWKWSKKKCKIPSKTFFKFVPTLLNKREVAKLLKERKIDFPEE